jgi:hypothetical protein
MARSAWPLSALGPALRAQPYPPPLDPKKTCPDARGVSGVLAGEGGGGGEGGVPCWCRPSRCRCPGRRDQPRGWTRARERESERECGSLGGDCADKNSMVDHLGCFWARLFIKFWLASFEDMLCMKMLFVPIT